MPNPALPAPRSPRYSSLDVWRGLACLLVVIFHSSFYVHAANRALPPAEQSAFFAFTERLWIGVPIFFVISGYCIAATVDSHRRKPAGWRGYFARRLRRIAPPYWCALGISLAAVVGLERYWWPALFTDSTAGFPAPGSLNAWQWFGNITLTESWRYLVVGSHPSYFLGHAWTLFYEEQFYAVAGLLLVLAPRRFFPAAVVVTLATLAAPAFGIPLKGTFLDGHWLMFAAGIAVYHSLNYAGHRQRWAILAALSAGVIYSSLNLALVWGLPNTFESNALAAFVFAILLIGARRWDGVLTTAKGFAPLRFCGTTCYSLYLIHWPICKAISHAFDYAGVRGPWGSLVLILPCCAAASLAAGYAFHVAIERRFLNPPAQRA